MIDTNMFRWLKWIVLGLVVGGLALGLSVKTYIASLNRREVRISEAGQAGQGLCNTGGYFTTKSGYRYCFIFKDSVSTYVQQIAECKAYGQLAKLTDGEIRQDILGIISQFNIEKQWLIDRVGPGSGGPVIFDTCTNLTAKFPSTDTSLYHDGDCSATHMILDKLNGAGGRFNDTVGDGIFGGLCQMTAIPSGSPSPSGSPAPRPNFQIRKFNDLDADGEKDANEGSTDKIWSFQYKVNDGDWIAIDTASASGLSAKITLPKNSKVEVEEITKLNWKITTPQKQTQTLSEAGKTYRFEFGNNWIGASPLPSASPSPSPGANQAWFVIHKFLDVNRNSVRETGEGTTNRTWEFEYQIDGDEKESYMIEPGEEEGEKIIVNKGVKVKVSELGQEGWLNTTGAELSKTLSDPKLYTFYFGNWPVGGVGGASPAPPAGGFPPTQPDTGTPTWLTVGAIGVGAILLTAKILLRL